jgi:hypothetical protein
MRSWSSVYTDLQPCIVIECSLRSSESEGKLMGPFSYVFRWHFFFQELDDHREPISLLEHIIEIRERVIVGTRCGSVNGDRRS